MTRAAACAVAVLLAGCGGSGDEEDAGAAPTANAAVAERCGEGAPERGAPPSGLFPAQLFPGGAFVVRWRDDRQGLLLAPGRLNDVYSGALQGAQQAGLPIVFQEVEVLDAELEVETDGDVVRLAFSRPRSCSDFTRAVVTKRPA